MNASGTEWVTPGATEDDVLGAQKNRLIDIEMVLFEYAKHTCMSWLRNKKILAFLITHSYLKA